MDEEVAPQKKQLPRPVIFFGAFVLLFTVLPTLQTIAIGFLVGFDSELFVIRLWSTGLVWLAPVMVALVVAPMMAPLNRKLLSRVRLVCAPITVLALGLIIWLATSDKGPVLVLALGVFMALSAWVNTFVVERFSAKNTRQSQT